MYCYCVRNKVNNKLYIGITNRKPSLRWKQHLQRVGGLDNNKFYNAVRKYGSDNFEIGFMDYTEQLTGVPNQSISHCCRGKRKSAGGYGWKYE